jgi:hypothetical protein
MKNAILWILALLITVSSAVYQRKTGPTYPISGETELEGKIITYELWRSHESTKDYEISIQAQDPALGGYIIYKRHKTDDPWSKRSLLRENGVLIASLPHQPPAGKLDYKVIVTHEDRELSLSGENPVTIRFKGAVPPYALFPHILIMFMAMLFSTRAGLEALKKKSNPRKLAIWTTGLLIVGGMILGPLVQKFAFGALWTGFPFGFDLTDNKTLIALVVWIIALIAGRKGKPARGWIIGASVITLIIFLIPHSLLGSELDYSKIDAQNNIQAIE